MNIQDLEEQKAYENALYIVGLVQDTMSLENQGLGDSELNILIEETKANFLKDGEYCQYLRSNDK